MVSFDVMVVGGGIGGLAVGYRLASEDRRVCVLEAREGRVRPKRGVSLQPNGLAALADLGLLSEVESIGARVQRVSWYDLEHRLLAKVDWSVLEHPQNYLLTVIPGELESLLRRKFASAGGSLHSSTSFVSFTRQEGGIIVKAQISGAPVEFSGKILIGADGEHSLVRSSLGTPTKIREYPDHFLLLLLPGVPIKDEGRQYFGRGKMMGVFPANNSTYIFYYIRSGRLEQLRAKGLEYFRQDLLSMEPELGSAVNSLATWDDLLYVRPKRVDVSSWVADRVALLGDAAHTLNPSLGQGLNMTLVDVATLAGVLDRCLEADNFSAAALKPYEDSRRKLVRFTQNQAELVARLYDTESRLLAWYAKRLLRKTGKSESQMLFTIEIASGLRDSIGLSQILRLAI
jgi:2-polyprenyl-6-methoxyphenol hydroxylase-like FAD-dependent oxidoreductase